RILQLRHQKFEHRRRVSQSHRFLEELVFLRQRLADNTGVLTADSHAYSDQSLERVQQTLGRRIARSVAQLCVADAAVLYRYDHPERVPRLRGAHREGARAAFLANADYTWMVDGGRSPDLRSTSVSYSAADLDRPTS